MNNLQRIFALSLCYVSAAFISAIASAQVNGPGPSDPNDFDTVINLPGDGRFLGGSIGNFTGEPTPTTQLNLTYGSFLPGTSFHAYGGSEVNIEGGYLGTFFVANSGSEVNIRGGAIGLAFSARYGSYVELTGGDFMLNGTVFSSPSISLNLYDVFTGTLADGSTFVFSMQARDRIDSVMLNTVALPAIDTTPQFVSTDIADGPSGLRAGQTLTLQEGGVLGGGFAVVDATLNIESGIVGHGLEAVGAAVNISGGSVGSAFNVYSGSQVNISGGNLGGGFASRSGSVVDISGGTVSAGFLASSGSELTISGGTFGRSFRVNSGSDVELIGGEFLFNGITYSGSTITLAATDVLSGTLADGTPFILSGYVRDRLNDVTLTTVALPAADTTTQVVSADTPAVPVGLRAGQALILQNGGALKRDFAAIDATLNIEGGMVGSGLEVANTAVNIVGGTVEGGFGAYSGSQVNISGGSVGLTAARSGSEVNISGGSVSNFLHVSDSVVNITDGDVGGGLIADIGGVVNITGGHVGASFDALAGSEVRISGGSVDSDFAAEPGSKVSISGGTMGERFTAQGGSEVDIRGGTVGTGFKAESGSNLELTGGEFMLNGAAYVSSTITLTDNDVFTGTLADGSPFVFGAQGSDELNNVALTTVAMPPADPTPQFVNAGGPVGLRSGQTLTLQEGGVLGNNFAIIDATLNIEGGRLGSFEAYKAIVQITNGVVGEGSSYADSQVSISGGTASQFRAYAGSTIDVSGGSVVALHAESGSKVMISGGNLKVLRVDSGSEVEIRGGTIGPGFNGSWGSEVSLAGGEFMLNGTAYTDSTISLSGGDQFTGTLADGSTFIFRYNFASSFADVNLTNVGVPAADLTPRYVNTNITDGPAGLRAGQTLTLQEGGVLGNSFAVIDATLNVEGGVVGDGFEASGANVNITGGSLGEESNAYSGSHVNISGGNVNGTFSAYSGSEVNVSGGRVRDFLFGAGGVMNISGGTLGQGFSAGFVSEFNISGGDLGEIARASFRSEVNLFGTEFYLDGVLLDTLAPDEPLTIFDRNVTLSGRLTDGSEFSFELNDDDYSSFDVRRSFFDPGAVLTVTLVASSVPEPSTGLLMFAAWGGLIVRRRRVLT